MVATLDLNRTYTAEEFMDLPTNGVTYELVDGELVAMSQPGDEHGTITGNLFGHLWVFLQEQKVGKVYTSTGFTLAPKTVRAPDVGFLVANRVQPITEKAVPVPPDLAVEVNSPNDVWAEVEKKVLEYRKAGVKLVWVISPVLQVVYIYHLDKNYPTAIGIDDELDGEDVVPGFKLSVKALFE